MMKIISILLCFALLSCANKSSKNQSLIAVIQDFSTNKNLGYVSFTELQNGAVRVKVKLSGLKAAHAFHIHEFGDFTDENAKTAGSHFNPYKKKHGSPNHEHHMGDLGNILADHNKKVDVEFLDYAIKLRGKNSILGRSVIIHEKADDFVTQPTGGAGARIAGGVIGYKFSD